jgi:ATP-dependent RNA helicase DeaD
MENEMSDQDDVVDVASPSDVANPTDAQKSSDAVGPDEMGFADLGLSEGLLGAVAEAGYESPTPIQQQTIPLLIEGRDVLGVAATGTGKTAAFILPLLEVLTKMPNRRAPMGLVVVPTRELALQVALAAHTYGRTLGVRVLPVYGGAALGPQIKSLSRGVDIVVATPGRALDLLNRGCLRLEDVRYVVLDEADEMLDMGFQEDIESLLGATSDERQTALFSATFPSRLQRVAKTVLTDPVRIRTKDGALSGDRPRVRQIACVVRRSDKAAALGRILDIEAPEAAIVFCRTRIEVDELADHLAARGYRVEALHGGFSQPQRERVMRRLRGGANDLLIATDVAARGIDVKHLTHVFNFNLPQTPEQYMHRIGRTGRAGREGVAITLLTRRERRALDTIGRRTGQPVEVRPVPSRTDLRKRQLSRVVERVTGALAEGDLENWREAAKALIATEETEVEDVVAALLRIAHESSVPELDDESDGHFEAGGGHHFGGGAQFHGNAPPFVDGPPRQAPPRPGSGARQYSGASGPPRFGGGGTPQNSGPRQHDQPHPNPDAGWARLWVGAGREAGVGPGDLVGAIAGESGISGRDIGAIRIHGRFSMVDVRGDLADMVVDRMRGAEIRGVKAPVRRDKEN